MMMRFSNVTDTFGGLAQHTCCQDATDTLTATLFTFLVSAGVKLFTSLAARTNMMMRFSTGASMYALLLMTPVLPYLS
jgi:ABC-type uncharacterized transport system involved in gliding motility auxiliary subunit